MMLPLLRRCCVVTTFATLFFILSSPLRADLATAHIALQTRQFELALAQAESLAATHPFDSAMIAARAHLELRQFEAARRAAMRAQALAPKLAAPRILKALALHGLGKPRRAMFHLRRAVDLSTERNERATATRLLQQIQAGLTVKLSGGLGIAPSSNINKISYSTTHTSINPLTGTLQTIPWTANEPQRSGSGLRLWSGLSYTLPKTQFGTQLASFNISTDVYKEPRFNRSSLSLNHRLVLAPAAQHQTTLTQAFTAVHQFNALESRIFSSSWSRRYALRDPQNPGQTALRDWSLGADIITRPDGKDSRVLKTNLRHYWPASASNQFNLGFGYTNRFSDAADVGNQEIAIDLGWRPIFKTSPYVLNFNVSLSLAKWKDLEITFPEKRRVRDRKISLNLSNPNLSYFGLTPSAQYSFLDRDANIEMFRVRSHDMFIGLVNAF